MIKIVFRSPGPYCNTDTAEVVDFPSQPTERELAEIGYDMAIQHYESYGDPEDDDIEVEYDYWWQDYDEALKEGVV